MACAPSIESACRLGALPPMRMTASWFGSARNPPNTRMWRDRPPVASSPRIISGKRYVTIDNRRSGCADLASGQITCRKTWKSSKLAAKLQTIAELDLEGRGRIDPPGGYGRG